MSMILQKEQTNLKQVFDTPHLLTKFKILSNNMAKEFQVVKDEAAVSLPK